MNVSAGDIFKNVLSALAIAFLLYLANVVVDALLKRFDVSFQHTVLLDKSGYIFQFDNPTWNAIDNITIGVARRLSVEATSIDNGASIKMSPSASFTSFTLSDLPPNRRTNFYISTNEQLDYLDISVVYAGRSYRLDDRNYETLTFVNFYYLINALMLFSTYSLLSIWFSSKSARLLDEIKASRSQMDSTREEFNKHRDVTESKFRFVEGRQLRLRLIMQKRIMQLEGETAVWRKFFVAIYTNVFSSSDKAERAMQIILQKLGIHHALGRALRDIPEDEFIEMLFDEKFDEKLLGKLP